MLDNRKRLLRELARHEPFDALEAAALADAIVFVKRHSDCFERTLEAGHVTASAWIVNCGLDEAVLVFHRRIRRWLQPGGHADGDSNLRRVAQREALEETGLRSLALASPDVFDVDAHEIPARGSRGSHVHYDIRFAFFADGAEVPIVSEESDDVRWFALSAIGGLVRDASIRRLVAKTPALRATMAASS